MRCVAHINPSCYRYGHVTVSLCSTHRRRSQKKAHRMHSVTHVLESCHTYECVMSRIWICHGVCMQDTSMAIPEEGASSPAANAMAAAAAATCEQCVAVCCSVVQCGAVCCSVLQYMQLMCIGQTYWQSHASSALQCAAIRCSVCCSVLQCVAVHRSVRN